MMMNKTQIEWVKNPDGTQGYTWNPITGCLNIYKHNGHCKGGDFPCYAYRLAMGRLGGRYLSNSEVAPLYPSAEEVKYDVRHMWEFYPRFWRERLDELEIPPKKRDWQKPKGIFVCDMGELFGSWIPDEWITLIFNMISLNPQHRFYLLTKQPQNLQRWNPFPDNCWVGVTATNEKMYWDATRYLHGIKARVKYISFEPLLDNVMCAGSPYKVDSMPLVSFNETQHLNNCGINWIIIGSQTKPYKPPKIEWVKEIVESADKAGIPIFLKNNLLKHLPRNEPFVKWTPTQAGQLAVFRQEMPK